jgi:uncharacterized protein (DUF1800 family)
MPISNEDLYHLLRRTEFVARPWRVAELAAMERAQAVDNIMAVVADPGVTTLTAPSNWERSEQYTDYWLNRMAHDSPRPIQEKIGFFWHGHFCSDMSKVGDATLMQQQLDLFRREGMGSVPALAKKMAVQVAMIRYLDNNDNRRTSPNQNFGRELMELFLLGVGNYTEADVEASTAAWTGHTDNWETDAYVWRADWHDNNVKTLLGQSINVGGDPQRHGDEVIDTIFGSGVVPVGPNAGRLTRDVAAEFLSKKLWTFFAGTTPSPSVIEHLRQVAVGNNFNVLPWVRALLLHDEFYAPATKQGLVRSPVDLVVALLFATGRRSEDVTPQWLMQGMGQRPQFPPNVSGWKHNGYFVNASAMAERTRCAQTFFWNVMRTYWATSGANAGQIVLPAGTLSKAEITGEGPLSPMPPNQLVDTLLNSMWITPTDISRNALYAFAQSVSEWERINVLLLVFLMPEMHTA